MITLLPFYESLTMPQNRVSSAERDRFRAIFQKKLTDEFSAGRIEQEAYGRAMQSSNKDWVIRRCIREQREKYGFEFDWSNIVAWISEHWLEILKFVLMLLPLSFNLHLHLNGRF